MKNKNPWVAAILNFLIPGAGYLYIKKRKIFSLGLIAALLILLFADFTTDYQYFSLSDPFYSIAGVIIMLAFAYDAYEEAKSI